MYPERSLKSCFNKLHSTHVSQVDKLKEENGVSILFHIWFYYKH